jgi:hypothetical protein
MFIAGPMATALTNASAQSVSPQEARAIAKAKRLDARSSEARPPIDVGSPKQPKS